MWDAQWWPIWGPVPPASETRIVAVAAEDRTLIVAVEDRTVHIEESR